MTYIYLLFIIITSNKGEERIKLNNTTLKSNSQSRIESASKRAKDKENEILSELNHHLDNKNITLATEAAIRFLENAYGRNLLHIWGLKYYKNLTRGDTTEFDKASTRLLELRGDVRN